MDVRILLPFHFLCRLTLPGLTQTIMTQIVPVLS